MTDKSAFISATGTGVGKTYAAIKIMGLLREIGLKCIPFKPIESGVISGVETDAQKLLSSYARLYGDNSVTLGEICLYSFPIPAAPFIAKENTKIDVEKIKERALELQKKCDILLIEGAGGLFVPIELDFFMVDLAQKTSNFTILISRSGLGCINEALLSIEELKKRRMSHALLFNRLEGDSFEKTSKPFFSRKFGEVMELQDEKSILKSLSPLF